MWSKKLGLLNLLAVTLVSILQAEQSSEECCLGERPQRITVRHIDPTGIGYNKGYTTAEGFFSGNWWEDWVLFLDARGHVFNDGKPAVNAGIGSRYVTESRIWGLNAYYDYRKTHKQHYNQVGFGAESLEPFGIFASMVIFPSVKSRVIFLIRSLPISVEIPPS